MVDVRRLLIGAGTVLATAGVAAVGGRALVRRARGQSDESSDEDFFTLADMDAVSRTVTARDGSELHLLEAGAGRPLVLLHGVTLQAGAWRYQFELADRFRVVAVDLRGHGRSTVGSADYGLDPLAADLADVLIALDLRDAIVVGHSMGGMTAMRFARRHADVLAERVGALLLLSTSADPVLGFGTAGSLRRVAAAIQGPAERVGWERLPTIRPTESDLYFGLIRLSFGEHVAPHLVEVTRDMMQAMRPEALSRSFLGLLANDEVDHLHAVRMPTTVMVGSRDLLTPLRAAKRIAHAITGAELLVVPGAGHQLMMERPADVALAIDALAARSAAPTRV